MLCSKCGNELVEGEKFCGKCGTKNTAIEEILSSETYCSYCGALLNGTEIKCPNCNKDLDRENVNNNTSNQKTKSKQKIKFSVAEVINKSDVINSGNRVAYIAKVWALQVRNRGKIFAIIFAIISAIYGFILQGDASYYDNVPYWLLGILLGIVIGFIIVAVFNTIAFIIRMGAEVIQLLDDIKKQKGSE